MHTLHLQNPVQWILFLSSKSWREVETGEHHHSILQILQWCGSERLRHLPAGTEGVSELDLCPDGLTPVPGSYPLPLPHQSTPASFEAGIPVYKLLSYSSQQTRFTDRKTGSQRRGKLPQRCFLKNVEVKPHVSQSQDDRVQILVSPSLAERPPLSPLNFRDTGPAPGGISNLTTGPPRALWAISLKARGLASPRAIPTPCPPRLGI